MKVLWLSTSKSLYKSPSSNDTYNGVGWVASLQREVMKCPNIQLGIAFLTESIADKADIQSEVSYFPIYNKRNFLSKLYHYHYGYKKWNQDIFANRVKLIIDEFHPDLIHIFGFECPLSDILGFTDIPVVVHIQGILNAFRCNFPSGMSKLDVLKYGSFKRERILGNGFLYTYNNMVTLARRESILFSKVMYVCGRTEWDKSVAELMASQAKYFHVDELLRPSFYTNRLWIKKKKTKHIIVSTLSENLYKGLDQIFKTADCLGKYSDMKYEWHIVGIRPTSSYIKLVEKTFNLDHTLLPLIFRGIMNEEQIQELLLSADVYVHPSTIDNSPNSVCEAQILGVPVIANNVGGISSLLSENSGVLVPSNDSLILAKNLIRLMTDFDYAKMLSEKGHQIAVKRHNKGAIIRDLLSMYHEIVDNNDEML